MRASLVKILSEQGAFDSTSVEGWEQELVDAITALFDGDGSSAAKFMEQWYVGYGHGSIGDGAVGGVLGVEGLSELACKALQHHGLFSGQQTSTRAVDVSKQRIVDPVGTPTSKAVQDRWMRFYKSSQEPVAEEVRRRYPRQDGEDEATYASAVKMRVFDILRGFLPAGLTTQTSVAMNLRQLSDHLTWLLHHPLEEVRRVGRLVQSILRERYPSSGNFGGSAALSGIGTKGTSPEEAAARDAWVAATAQAWTYQDVETRPGRSIVAEELDVEFLTTVDLDALYLPSYKKPLTTRPRGCVLPRVFDDLGTCTASFLLDWGAWRDIERQRAGTCRVPMLTTEYGFEPWYLDQLPARLREEALALIGAQVFDILYNVDDPLLQQYYIPFGFRVPTTLTYTLPIWVYVLELRTGPTVHPSLRAAMLGVVREFEEAFGDAVPLHIDRRPDAWTIRRGAQTIERRGAPEHERRAAPDGERRSAATTGEASS